MTPPEKALKLMQQFGFTGFDCNELDNTTLPESVAIKCAMICVDEIISRLEMLHKPEYTTFIIGEGDTADGYAEIDFWQAVKEDLIKRESK